MSGTLIDGPVTSQTVDSSGEILMLDGLDISDFLEGRAFANFEHNNDSPEDLLGIFRYAKKIYKADDCENDRQKLFWEQLKTPFLYAICELFDDEDHPGAVAVAAMLRYFKKREEPVRIGFSIEGATLKRDSNKLERTVGRKAALTVRPCNRQCWADVLDAEKAEEMIKKTEASATTTVEVDYAIISDVSMTPEVDLKIAVLQLHKTLTASMGDVAPSMRTQGAALASESLHRTRINTLKSAIRDWDRKRPLIEVVKAALPEVSDDYLDHFIDIAEDLSLKKGGPSVKVSRIGSHRSENISQDDDQKRLIDGIYLQGEGQNVDRISGNNPILHLKNDAGEDLVVKQPQASVPGADDATNSAMYHQMAKRFFGMGAHVPTTNHFTTVQRDAPWSTKHGRWSAMKKVNGDTVLEAEERYKEHLNRNRPTIHKLVLMDAITGTRDRHHGNAMIDKEGNLYHIDNDYAFDATHSGIPFHLDYVGKDVIDPAASDWLRGLDTKALVQHMMSMGADRATIARTAQKLDRARHLSTSGKSLKDMVDFIGTGKDDPNVPT